MSSQREAWLNRWHVNPSVQKEYDVIDGLRGIAILLVVGCHLVYINPLSGTLTHFIGGVFAAGSCGVIVFFALSGFLISWPFWKRKVAGSELVVPPGYAKRRFWKIYPPLALSVILLTPIYILRSHDWSFAQLAAQWFVGVPLVKPISGDLNPVMWSLIVEVHYYLLLPLLFLALKKVSARTTLWILTLGFLVIPTAWRWINASRGIYFTLHPDMNVHFPAMLDAFAFGIFMAALDNLQLLRRPFARVGDAGLVVLMAGLVVSSLMALYSNESEFVRAELLHWMAKIASLLLLCYVADPAHPRSVALSVSWLRWLGIISYEWYLFHQPIAIWVRAWFGPTSGNILIYCALLTVSLVMGVALAAVVYKFFSLPILKYGRSKSAYLKSASRAEPVRALEKV
jgi:peptidoglycan/LPS O-acetylase OafA/YrhL